MKAQAERPEVCRTPMTSRQSCLSLCVVCLCGVCSVLFSFFNATNCIRGLNVLIVKIRLEFVFNRCKKRISAFDISFGNAVDCRQQGEISVKEMSRCSRNLIISLAGIRNNQTQTPISI